MVCFYFTMNYSLMCLFCCSLNQLIYIFNWLDLCLCSHQSKKIFFFEKIDFFKHFFPFQLIRLAFVVGMLCVWCVIGETMPKVVSSWKVMKQKFQIWKWFRKLIKTHVQHVNWVPVLGSQFSQFQPFGILDHGRHCSHGGVHHLFDGAHSSGLQA